MHHAGRATRHWELAATQWTELESNHESPTFPRESSARLPAGLRPHRHLWCVRQSTWSDQKGTVGIKGRQSVAAPLASHSCKSDHLQLSISHFWPFNVAKCCQKNIATKFARRGTHRSLLLSNWSSWHRAASATQWTELESNHESPTFPRESSARLPAGLRPHRHLWCVRQSTWSDQKGTVGIKGRQSVAAPLASHSCKSDHLQLSISHFWPFNVAKCCQKNIATKFARRGTHRSLLLSNWSSWHRAASATQWTELESNQENSTSAGGSSPRLPAGLRPHRRLWCLRQSTWSDQKGALGAAPLASHFCKSDHLQLSISHFWPVNLMLPNVVKETAVTMALNIRKKTRRLTDWPNIATKFARRGTLRSLLLSNWSSWHRAASATQWTELESNHESPTFPRESSARLPAGLRPHRHLWCCCQSTWSDQKGTVGIEGRQSVAAPLASDFCKSDHFQLSISHFWPFNVAKCFQRNGRHNGLNIPLGTTALGGMPQSAQFIV